MIGNSINLIGNIGNNFELKVLDSGSSVVNLTFATNRNYKNKAGEKIKEVDWHNLTFFGGLADLCDKYLQKGSSIAIEGNLKYNKYVDESGANQVRAEIIVEEMKFISGLKPTE